MQNQGTITKKDAKKLHTSRRTGDVPRRYVTRAISQCTVLRLFAPVFCKIDTPEEHRFSLDCLVRFPRSPSSCSTSRLSREGRSSRHELTFNH